MLTIHLRIHEGTQAIAGRIRGIVQGEIRLPLGRSFHDSEAVVHLEDGPYAYLDGPCEIRLPPGFVRVQATRGPLYTRLDQESHLAMGKLALRFALTRRDDPRIRGWFAGDLRVHGLTPHGALLQAQGEDLAVVQLLLRDGDSLVAFSGDQPCLSRGDSVVAVNTLNSDPVGGSVSLLHAHRVVFPLGTREQPWSVADWCDQCHRKRGLVVWPDTPRLTPEFPAGEVLAAAILGQVDVFEVCSWDSIALYHELLQSGLRLALVGSSGRETSRQCLGSVRTYARLAEGEPFRLDAWIQAVRQGQTVASTGPVIELTRQGKAWHAVAGPDDHLTFLCDGKAIASGRGRIEVEIPTQGTHWVAATCQGPHGWAHTSAVWVENEGQPWRRLVGGRITTALDQTQRHGTDTGRAELLSAARRRLQETE